MKMKRYIATFNRNNPQLGCSLRTYMGMKTKRATV